MPLGRVTRAGRSAVLPVLMTWRSFAAGRSFRRTRQRFYGPHRTVDSERRVHPAPLALEGLPRRTVVEHRALLAFLSAAWMAAGRPWTPRLVVGTDDALRGHDHVDAEVMCLLG